MTDTETNIHPGSWVGDTAEEFKKLPTWGKALAVGLLVFVAYLGYRAYQNKGNVPISGGPLPATSNQSGSSSPFPQISTGPDSSVPLLPGNVNPVFSGSGNLVGYQASAPASPTPVTPPSQVGSTPNAPTLLETIRARFTGNTSAYDTQHPEGVPLRSSPNSGNNVIGSLGYGSSISASNPTQGGGNFSPTSGETQWYQVTSGGKTGYVSSHDVNFSPSVQPSSPSGGGGMSWQSRVYRLTHYTPQTGDNMNEVAAKLGYGNWNGLGQSEFKQGERFQLP